MRDLIRSAVTIRATEKFVDWIKSIHGGKLPDQFKWAGKESLTYLLPCIETESDFEEYLDEYYLKILKHFVTDPYSDSNVDLSGITLSIFKEWFTLEYSVAVVDIFNGRDLVDSWEDPSEYDDEDEDDEDEW